MGIFCSKPSADNTVSEDNTAETVFEGCSVWFEIPFLQPIVESFSKKYNFYEHQAHLTVLYGLTSDVETLKAQFPKFKSKLEDAGIEKIVLKPNKVTAGESSLFPQFYCDIFFEYTEEIGRVWDIAWECFDTTTTMDEDKLRNSFRNNPHGCVCYLKKSADFDPATAEKEAREWGSGIFDQPFTVSVNQLALWNTNGTVRAWRREIH